MIFRDIATAVPAHGRPVVREWVETYFRAFHDARMESRIVAVDGDVLVYEWRATGTHDGDFMGMRATGNIIEVDGCSIANVGDDGLVHSEKNYWDVAGMLQQMGVLPICDAGDPATPPSSGRWSHPAGTRGASVVRDSDGYVAR